MSQRDLVAELRGARLSAPVEVRERVRAIAASSKAPERRFFRRRSLVLLVPIAAAIAGTVILTRPNTSPKRAVQYGNPPTARAATSHGKALTPSTASGATKAFAPAPSQTRAQQYSASIGLRVKSAGAVSDAVKQALRIASSLGGHPTTVNASSAAKSGSAYLVLRIPRQNVQRAVTRLSQLGTITSEDVQVKDVQATLDATGRKIVRLQHKLMLLHLEPQSTQRDHSIDALTTQIERLQRAEAATLRSVAFATVRLTIATAAAVVPAKHRHGPLHGIGVAAYWAGIGAVYAAAIGGPLLVLALLVFLGARAVRRRRVDALLSQT